MTFLVTVNDTWYPDEYNKTCMATVKSPALQPGVKYNDTMQIHIGECDHGSHCRMMVRIAIQCHVYSEDANREEI